MLTWQDLPRRTRRKTSSCRSCSLAVVNFLLCFSNSLAVNIQWPSLNVFVPGEDKPGRNEYTSFFRFFLVSLRCYCEWFWSTHFYHRYQLFPLLHFNYCMQFVLHIVCILYDIYKVFIVYAG